MIKTPLTVALYKILDTTEKPRTTRFFIAIKNWKTGLTTLTPTAVSQPTFGNSASAVTAGIIWGAGATTALA